MKARGDYRIGVVGMRRGLALARSCAKLSGCRLVAIADLVPERLDEAARELGEVARYDHHAAMLEEERLDVVVVATLGLHHREPVVAAAAKGVRGIYVEKPMATSLADCDAMIEACRASGAILTVGHQRRWNPNYRVARGAVRDGAVGRLINGYVMWSTGRVGSVGTHYFDALNMVVDDEVAWVSGRLDPASTPQPQWPDILDPGGMGTIVYQNGARITVDAMEDTTTAFDMYLFGTKGQLHVLRDGREFRYWAHDEEVPARQMYSQGTPIPPRDLAVVPGGAPSSDDWESGLEELLDCIDRKREPSSTGDHGRQALEVIVALHLSSGNNMQPVQLPLTGDALGLDLRFR